MPENTVIEPSSLKSGPARTLIVPRTASRKVKMWDRLAGHVIRFGGAFVIVAVATIFLFIGKEALPLFLPATSQSLPAREVPASARQGAVSLLGLDEYETYAYWLTPTGSVALAGLEDWNPVGILPIEELADHPVSAAYRSSSKDLLFLGTKDGQLLLTQVKFRAVYTEQGRHLEKRLEEPKRVELSSSGSPVRWVFGRQDSSGVIRFAAACQDGSLYTGSYEEGDDPKVEPVGGLPPGPITGLAMDSDGEKLFVASADGKLYHWQLSDNTEAPFETLQPDPSGQAVTALEFVIGDNSLLLGYGDGRIEQWFGVRQTETQVLQPFKKIRSFEPLPAKVTRLVPSGRSKGFVAAGEDGTIKLYFTTSDRTLLRLQAGAALRDLAYSPKLTRIVALTASGQARQWEIDNPHPEVSWATLFSKVWYEGYAKPDYVWQSTGGSDDFESKFSLVPLTLGTLKGAIYGLIFAIPIAVLAAIYTSQFMGHRLRAVVKPAVEIMAALPSVVIGFLAGLWLAPLLERHVLSVAALLVVIPLFVFAAVIGWNLLPGRWRFRLPSGTELGLIALTVIIGFAVSVQLGPVLETWLFHGDLRQWVFTATGQQFEQRNSIVIGFAMGFAVIPIIFTISEDALSNVPQHFISGSLALGANRWQTATRIILPTASPGIFSAVMVGFGRAVGETMIVLMATGNTPILSFSPFNGMRTLSANVAVEIPEAPVGGTLYRVLFLTAILLFFMTFLVNTVAEIVRQRLREKYKAV
jgi:phosphate transport system permease protein